MVQVRCKLIGRNHELTQSFTLPILFDGLYINTDPSKPYDRHCNVRIHNIVWFAPNYSGPGRNEGWYTADAATCGHGGMAHDFDDLLVAQGWEIKQ